jgi:acetate kinase
VSDIVLALNAGSSTLKYALYRSEGGVEQELASATVPTHGSASAAALDAVLAGLPPAGPITRVGHRLVHGGELTEPVAVDKAMLARLHELEPLAPLHLPPALQLLEAALQRLPTALHVACFDTAFHRDLPELARRLPLPLELHERGIRRYGFHGLSYQYVLSQLETPAPARLIIAHLGSGASLAAVRDGRCIDTSMGFTPAGGIPMGTRTGDLDPGVLLYLQRAQGLTREQLEHLVNQEAGLLGVGGSADMQELLAREATGDARASLAVAWFAYALKKQIGGYVAALGGLDCLVFTGGIGEHAARVRELACSNLHALGIELDAERNRQGAELVSSAGATCQVRVIRTDEDRMICRATLSLPR